MRITTTVNGTVHEADDVWPGESLLYVLRERMGLPGSKNACEQGECGSCTVYLDGEPVCSCLVAAGQAIGREVTTVEGLAEGGELHPVQQAFVECGAVQCGFCTPGLVVASHDLLNRCKRPTDPEIREASASVVKVIGRASSCNRVIEGSGFVVAPERVMTNAHVVAGVAAPVVTAPNAEPLESRVVHFDPSTDVAVLAVPGLDRAALAFRDDAATGAHAAVVGYPGNGPLRTEPARVRGEYALLGSDIYDDETVSRDVLSMRGEIRPGNSGGPLVADDGLVYGVVFAASLTDPDTGYALAPSEVESALEAADAATDPVPTGGCV